MRPYRYIQLEESHIRLLRLLPGPEDSRIRCSLVAFNLFGTSARSEYEAKPYVWGDANQTEEIECEGARLQVNINLVDALCHASS
jgi:hypothetical protein